MVFWFVKIVDEGLEIRQGGGIEVAIFGSKALLFVRPDLVEVCGKGYFRLTSSEDTWRIVVCPETSEPKASKASLKTLNGVCARDPLA